MIKAFWWWLKSTWWQLSYWIRPYDMLADRRRWCWQAAQECAVLWCSCERPSPTFRFDAHNRRRWCGTCQGRQV